MRRIYILAICVIVASTMQAQQDPQYNLYQFNQMVINPAYAGARDGMSVIGAVRQQWSGFNGAPRTACMSVHGPILNKNLGVGLTFVQDAMGPRRMNGIYANVAYILKLNSKYKLSFGLNAGYNTYKFDFSKLTFKSTEANSQIIEPQGSGVVDLGTGLYFRSNTFFAGFSVTHLNKATVYNYTSGNSNQLNYILYQHTFFTMGKSFKLSDNVIFAPTIMIRQVQGRGNGDLNLNFFLFKKMWLGVFFKGNYGPGFLLQYYVTNKFRVAYSYDTGMKDVRRLGPANEIMIGFDFSEVKSKIISPRFL